MGRVYRATDDTLHRDVALKVIHGALARDAAAAARFEREALAVASLSHPNIVSLYDAGTHDGTPYAVMELLDGETLRARLAAGPLPPRKAIEYGLQIARAIAAAHSRGILHRDIKPDNIFITRDGHVKVLDFGLAHLTENSITSDGATRAASTPGLVLGTVGYMAPEQLRGGAVDERADIFALGAVLYEMLSGRRAFEGESQADVVSAILQHDPPEISGTGTIISPVLDRIVRRCLEKNPDDRFHSARDLAFGLEAVGAGSSVSGAALEMAPRSPSHVRRAAVPLLAAVAVGALGLAAWLWRRPAEAATAPPVRFTIDAYAALIPEAAVSPDGRWMAWTALPRPGEGGDATTSIWLRSLDSTELRPVTNTATGFTLVFSHDSRELWFIEGNVLNAVDIASGRKRTVLDLQGDQDRTARGYDVNAAGDLVIALGDGLYASTADARALRRLSDPAKANERAHRWPTFFPDGRRYLYQATRGDGSAEIRVASLDDASFTSRVELPAEAGRAVVDPSGYLVFGHAGALFAQRYDFERLTLIGRPAKITDGLPSSDVVGWYPVDVSATGVLVLRQTPERLSQFEWIDRSGKPLGKVGGEEAYNNFDLSPDGSRLAVIRRSNRDGNSLHVFDIERGSSTILVNAGKQNQLSDPTWSPDGTRVAYREGSRLVVRGASGGLERVLADGTIYPDSWSRDGKWLAAGQSSGSNYDLIAVATDGSGSKISLTSNLRVADEPRFSRDGKWVVFHSVVDRRPEVFLVPFPPTGERWQLSIEGGVQPRWNGNGRELFFLDLKGQLMAVAIPEGSPQRAERPRALFDLKLVPNTALDQFTPSPDGSKFLVRRSATAAAERAPIEVLLNWRALVPELAQR